MGTDQLELIEGLLMDAAFVLALFGALIFADHQDFLETANKQKAKGYEWHYVGVTDSDPKAKAILGKVKSREPYILWKLRKPEDRKRD
ncbi:MAG: hypothetical protein VX987_15635 [Pseudomonadota bacterium]|nr:hypothetical protein [Pseudomonadota bacterium]